MNELSPRERLIRVLRRKKTDRPPVICTGGMMNAAIVDVMNKTGHTLPEAHSDEEMMAGLAADVYKETGFENIGVPFCMTVEAEVLGSEIDFGTLSCEPKIARETYPSVSRMEFKNVQALVSSGRICAVAQAAYRLSAKHPDVPVIGSLTGPISTAASIVNPLTFLRELRKDRENAHRVIDYISRFLVAYAQLLADNGAAVIAIGDPTSTGEILGPKMFEEYAVRYLNKIIAGVHSLNVPVIVHICGDMKAVRHLLPDIGADAISTDALVNLRLLKQDFPGITTMGNLSTYLLQFGTPDKIAGQAGRLVRDGVDIISPACGLSTSSALANIRAMTDTVKES